MRNLISGAGLMLGATAMSCALTGARADDLRTRQALIESGLFLSQAEASAAFARLDTERPKDGKPVPGTTAYWESGAVSYGQGDRAGRTGYGGSTTQMRAGFERQVENWLTVGAMAGAGFGTLGSGDVSADTVGVHTDAYAKFGGEPLFAKALIGASAFDYGSIERGEKGSQCFASSSGGAARIAGQIGARKSVAGVIWMPMVDVASHVTGLAGYREFGGVDPMYYSARRSVAAIGTVQLRGVKSVRITPRDKLDLEGYVGAQEVLAYSASMLSAVSATGVKAKLSGGTPTGRGMFGGLGVGSVIAPGVNVKFTYDYGLRDHVATHTSRAKLGISF